MMRAPSGYKQRIIYVNTLSKFLPEEHANQLEISFRGHSILIYIVKSNTKIDGMGSFDSPTFCLVDVLTRLKWPNINKG